jgi:hypothetical protein
MIWACFKNEHSKAGFEHITKIKKTIGDKHEDGRLGNMSCRRKEEQKKLRRLTQGETETWLPNHLYKQGGGRFQCNDCQHLTCMDCQHLMCMDCQHITRMDCQHLTCMDCQHLICMDCQHITRMDCQYLTCMDCQHLMCMDCQLLTRMDCQHITCMDCEHLMCMDCQHLTYGLWAPHVYGLHGFIKYSQHLYFLTCSISSDILWRCLI